MFWTGGGGIPGNAGGGWGDDTGEAVTDMSSSSGDWTDDDSAVVSRPTWVLGEAFEEVVLCALLQFIEMGSKDEADESVKEMWLFKHINFYLLGIVFEYINSTVHGFN